MRFKTLDLSNNANIGDSVCATLAKLLRDHTPLTTLILDGTWITQKGLADILKEAEKSTNISTISIKNCLQIDLLSNPLDESYIQVVSSMKKNCSIVNLYTTDDMKVDPELRDDFDKQLEINKEIVDIIFPRVME